MGVSGWANGAYSSNLVDESYPCDLSVINGYDCPRTLRAVEDRYSARLIEPLKFRVLSFEVRLVIIYSHNWFSYSFKVIVIPTTRSKSPKLGRRNSGDATGGETGPRVTKPNDSSSFILKKPITKPQPKVETQEKSGKAEERRKEVKKGEANKKRSLFPYLLNRERRN
ncbi:hypothetical protein DY000_02035366 [Brassica cretica]|uniref:Uncharacterized protein n=1 Tax=Brassica cretica TaxID=69181 RepID=A0ABQ7DUA6_BRACR|nr:hypothetical protein DY000_02035366 [Brassica cretica]